MTITAQGELNTTALVVPDIRVQIVEPRLLVNGIPSNVLGVVGTASWGPVGQPTVVGGYAAYVARFGAAVARKHDMGTHVATASLQGASDFRCVRVTDGTDLAASGAGPAGCITFVAAHTGRRGNGIQITLTPGSKTGSWKAAVALPGVRSELFDNVEGAGNAFWVALADAINKGQGPLRGPSQIVGASAGAGTAAPAADTYTLSGGTDGDAVAQSDLVGQDDEPRKGMYALRGQKCGLLVLSDCDDPATWTTQAAFGLSEQVYAVTTGQAGEDIGSAVAAKRGAGLDTYAVKAMFGDWLYWLDPGNGVRLVSPQGFVAGRLANLSPEQSSLNKPLQNILGSQRSGLPGAGGAAAYSEAELSALLTAGIDIVCNPAPGGAYWAVRGGRNSSSNAAVRGDNYPRLTNYIATTLDGGMGRFIGRVITRDLMREARSTLLAFLEALYSQGILSTIDGTIPYSVVCGPANNPADRLALGHLQADVDVRYGPILDQFLVNLRGGQTVEIQKQTTVNGLYLAA